VPPRSSPAAFRARAAARRRPRLAISLWRESMSRRAARPTAHHGPTVDGPKTTHIGVFSARRRGG
jgi:hypothetical protein